MITDKAGTIAATVAPEWDGIPTASHYATVFRLYTEEFGLPMATQAEFLSIFPNPNGVINSLLMYGKRLMRPGFGHLTLTPGSILVFAKGVAAVNSCVALTDNTVVGYDQDGWFRKDSGERTYSTHHTNEINWYGGTHPRDVRRSGSSTNYNLFAIGEHIAKARIRQLAEPHIAVAGLRTMSFAAK